MVSAWTPAGPHGEAWAFYLFEWDAPLLQHLLLHWSTPEPSMLFLLGHNYTINTSTSPWISSTCESNPSMFNCEVWTTLCMHKWAGKYIYTQGLPGAWLRICLSFLFFSTRSGIRGKGTRKTHIYKYTHPDPRPQTAFFTCTEIPCVHHSDPWPCRSIAWLLKFEAKQTSVLQI